MKSLLICLLCLLALPGTTQATDYLVIVFDSSGSMGDLMSSVRETRLSVAKRALIDVVSKAPPTTKVGILTFNGWAYDIQDIDQAKIKEAIDNIQSSGSTPLYEHIRAGATRLLKERQSQGNVGYYKLIVVTDGEADHSDAALNDDSTFYDGSVKPGILKDILSRGVVVDAIGLDMAGNHTLATQINGAYMRGDNPESLTQSLKQAVAEVGFGTTQDVSDEAFREISELPETFVVAALEGLTTFSNHPIGEKPDIVVVREDGTVAMVPDPNNEAVPAPGQGVGGVACAIVAVVAALALLLLAVFVGMSNRRY